MSDAVLVTGAFGLVGSATVRHLTAAGRRVVATDLDTPANRRAAGALPAGVRTHWADLTDPAAVEALRLLAYQHHPWPQMLAETAQRAGLLRYPLRLLAPAARQILTRRSPYHHRPGRYADPWEAIRRRWGAAAVDGRTA